MEGRKPSVLGGDALSDVGGLILGAAFGEDAAAASFPEGTDGARAVCGAAPGGEADGAADGDTRALTDALHDLDEPFFPLGNTDQRKSLDHFRANYRRFRTGNAHGAHGELEQVKDRFDVEAQEAPRKKRQCVPRPRRRCPSLTPEPCRRRSKEENKALHRAVERRRTHTINVLIARLKDCMAVRARGARHSIPFHPFPFQPLHSRFLRAPTALTVGSRYAPTPQERGYIVKKDKCSVLAASLSCMADLQGQLDAMRRERSAMLALLDTHSVPHGSLRPAPGPGRASRARRSGVGSLSSPTRSISTRSAPGCGPARPGWARRDVAFHDPCLRGHPHAGEHLRLLRASPPRTTAGLALHGEGRCRLRPRPPSPSEPHVGGRLSQTAWRPGPGATDRRPHPGTHHARGQSGPLQPWPHPHA